MRQPEATMASPLQIATTRSDHPRPWATAGLLLIALALGAAVGTITALAASALSLLGLYELAAGGVGAFALVASAHAVGSHGLRSHLAAAALFAVTWLCVDLAVDGALSRRRWIADVGAAGLMLADEAVLRDDDDPAALVDDSLLADTGARGWRGATRLRIDHGLLVLRAGEMTRVVAMPSWLHLLALGARAGVVALLVARALAHLRAEPRCGRCGSALRRARIGYVDEAEAADLASAWADDQRVAPDAGAKGAIAVLEDRCPAGCSIAPGWELRRLRAHGLGRAAPGVIAALPALHATGDHSGDSASDSVGVGDGDLDRRDLPVASAASGEHL
jgi:hypothetical protein